MHRSEKLAVVNKRTGPNKRTGSIVIKSEINPQDADKYIWLKFHQNKSFSLPELDINVLRSVTVHVKTNHFLS